MVTTIPENAPTDIKPAWPSDNSPRIPTVRLSETAMMTYAQIGTSKPFIELEMLPVSTSACTTTNATMTIPKESSVSRPLREAAYFFSLFILFRPLKPFH